MLRLGLAVQYERSVALSGSARWLVDPPPGGGAQPIWSATTVARTKPALTELRIARFSLDMSPLSVRSLRKAYRTKSRTQTPGLSPAQPGRRNVGLRPRSQGLDMAHQRHCLFPNTTAAHRTGTCPPEGDFLGVWMERADESPEVCDRRCVDGAFSGTGGRCFLRQSGRRAARRADHHRLRPLWAGPEPQRNDGGARRHGRSGGPALNLDRGRHGHRRAWRDRLHAQRGSNDHPLA